MANANEELKQWFQKALDDNRKTLRHELQKDLEVLSGSEVKTTHEELLVEFKKQQNLTKELSDNLERHVADQFAAKNKAETMKLMLEKQVEETSEHISKENRGMLANGELALEAEAQHLMGRLTQASQEVKTKVSHAIPNFLEPDAKRKARMQNARWYHYMDTLVLVVVCMSLVNMLVEMEWEASKSEASLGRGEYPDQDLVDAYNIYFRTSEHIFNAVFLLELILRMYFDRCAYFMEALNVMDFGLVMFTSVQLYIMDPLDVSSGGNLSVFRCLRMGRFLRAFRFIKMAIFTDLRVLITTCIASLSSLFWSMVLLFMIMFVSSLMMCNLLTDAIQDKSMDMDFRVWAFEKYGNTARSAYTMFEITMSGGWPGYFGRLVHERNWAFAFVAVFYVTFVVFAVIRIISAIFLKQTLQVASKDSDMQATEAHAKAVENGKKLQGVFKALDTTNSGLLTKQEFFEVTSHPDVMAVLTQFELQIHDIQGLFDLLDNGDGQITYDEFIQGVMRLKGQARSLDVIAISRNTDKMHKMLNQLLQRTMMVERTVLKVIAAGDLSSGENANPSSYSTI